MSDDQKTPAMRAEALARQLRAQGHDDEAARIEAAIARGPGPGGPEDLGHGVLHALRDACQTILTAIEAIDPVSITAIDELRLEVDKYLMPHGERHPGDGPSAEKA
ncbi:MAG TPA: hypothetical protein VL752_00675 [Acidisoma sp.]|uniref:hypothetical protein n=1 Tax=Acidisoma sp. TaxID=1872115 RepID=UPI002C022A36|nr:hypothetical protein [Acidisoma sp.]HTH99429.1 hypothetical protein [Acidisoma sp.]